MEDFKKAMEEISKSLQRMVEDLKEKKDYQLVEEGDEVRIEIDMPGLEPADIALSVTKDGTAVRPAGRGNTPNTSVCRLR